MKINWPRLLQKTDFTSFVCLLPRTVQPDDTVDIFDVQKEGWCQHGTGDLISNWQTDPGSPAAF